MKHKIKVVIQFNGAGFYGWQIQNQTSPTVQEKFNQALEKIYKTSIHTIGSGRTDTGVHSLDHHVVFTPPFEIELDKLVLALNAHLPETIRALTASKVGLDFRPTNDAISKEYHYYFSNEKNPSSFFLDTLANISFPLDLELMQKACSLFVGEYDFKSFNCTGSQPSSTVRTIFDCRIEVKPAGLDGILPQTYCLVIKGDGFLKQMVRLIVGAVWSVGRNKITLEMLAEELNQPTGRHLAPVVPPMGLYKFKVNYQA